jgi:hypothetical protein
MKYCFEQDESGHWYSIPVDKKKDFESWAYDEDYDGEDFEECRLNMHISNYQFEYLEEIE